MPDQSSSWDFWNLDTWFINLLIRGLYIYNCLFIFRSELNNAIREGGTPFNRVHGRHLFDYPSFDSRFNQVFNVAMDNHSQIIMRKVLECYKGFKDIKRLVDVGGGLGANIHLITSKYPHIHGINFDLRHVIQHAPSYSGMVFLHVLYHHEESYQYISCFYVNNV